MSVDTSAPRSRRAILGAALGGLGAVIASRLVTPEAVTAANGDAVQVGNPYIGTAETSITTSGAANAIVGHSADGTGVWGANDNNTAVPDFDVPGRATGLIGTAGDVSGAGVNTGEVGVYGYSNVSQNSTGVWGDTLDGFGVYGSGFNGVYGQGVVAVTGDAAADGTGVYGFAGSDSPPDPPPGVAVQATAESTSQVALNVTGKAKFSRSGRTFINAGFSSHKVTMAGVSGTGSYVIATLQTHKSGVYVASVVPSRGSFTIYLNKAPSTRVYIGYLVIN